MPAPAVGKLQFLRPQPLSRPNASTEPPENVVTRIRNQTTSGRTIRPSVETR